ncbi:MAG: hypothetical protein U0746_19860 [Gemmataceae bacterium]
MTLIRGSLNIGRSFRDEPLRPSQAWRARMRKDAVRGLERLLGHVELPDATLAELGREFAAELDDDLLLLAARGTLAQADRVAEMARRGEMPASQFRSACEGADAPSPVKSVRDWVIDRIGIDTAGYHADALANARLVLDAARRPWPEHWQAIQALDPPTHWQRTRLGRSTLLGVQTFALDVARLRCAMVAIAVERHRLAHGDWPASLTTLGPLAGDPFTGGPLHYRRTAEGVEVFVASPPFDDQGDGWIDPAVGGLPLNQGIGFCLYDVPHRNQVGGR